LAEIKRTEKELCQNCGKREATTNWVGDGGVIEYVHGFYQRWCDYCATKATLAYARKQARRIPSLERKLAKLKAK